MSERLAGVQSLRGLAATLVVIAHAVILGIEDLNFPDDARGYASSTGAYGVFVFFVISGFIMTVTTREQFGIPSAPTIFLLKRFLRVVPIYWAITAVYMARKLLAGQTYSLNEIFSSLLFLPYGRDSMEPILGLGWTLNYEIFFYAVFAFCLLFSARIGIPLLLAIFGIIVAIGFALPDTAPAPIQYWTRPIILYFVAGVLLGLTYLWSLSRTFLPIMRLWMVTAVTISVCALPSLYLLGVGSIPNPWVAGPAIAIGAVSIAALIQISSERNYVERTLQLIGDASYSIYLTHIFTHIPIVIIWRALSLPASFSWLFYSAAVLAASVLGVLVYIAFERPVSSLARQIVSTFTSKLQHKSPPTLAVR